MPRCNKCGKKGLFLKIEDDTGLCLACNEDFAREGKILTQKMMEAKNKATTEKDTKEIVRLCQAIEHHGNKLIALHQTYNLEPSHELLDLIKTYQKMRETTDG
ncbi:MAG: hypothetical protein JRJ85_06080 [Deltaproteobacteria bacterium]|nr:hypothetical protein [Deltaproteobacteria bacterium]